MSPTAEAVHEPGPHGGTVVGRGRAGDVEWAFEIALYGQEERTWLVEGGPTGGGSSSMGRRVAVSGSAMEVRGTGSSPERWYLAGSLAPGVARLVLELSDGTRIGVPAMGSELTDAGQRKWFAVVLDLDIDIMAATAVHDDGSETSVSHHLWGVVLPDLSEQRGLAAAIASGPDKRALALWRELTQASHLPEPRGEVVRVLRPDDVPWRWPLRPLERDAGLL